MNWHKGLLVCCLTVWVVTTLASGIEELDVRVSGTGFHLQLHVRGKVDGQAGDTLLVQCAFPRQTFVDRYELAELQRFGLFPAHTLSDLAIDLEKPADSPAARDFQLELRLPLSSGGVDVDVRLPFHLRYQPPDAADAPGAYRAVELPPAQAVLLRADGGHRRAVVVASSSLVVSAPIGQHQHRAVVTLASLLATVVGAAGVIAAIARRRSRSKPN